MHRFPFDTPAVFSFLTLLVSFTASLRAASLKTFTDVTPSSAYTTLRTYHVFDPAAGKNTANMPEHDALILSYSHLVDFPRASDALQILKKVASLVKPIMRARGWKVRELAEFYPDQANLLGMWFCLQLLPAN